MNNPKKYHHHYNIIMDSDLKHPTGIIKNKKGKWEIIDGLHRLAKAKILGMGTVNVTKR